jgi:phage gp16-like protein
MRKITLALLAPLILGGTAMAQGKPEGQKPQDATRQTQEGARAAVQSQTAQQRQQQFEHMARNNEQLALQIRETNRWMEQNRSREEYRALGQQLGQSCDQLQQMIRQTRQIRDTDQDLLRDRDRVRELDRLQDRLQDMDRTMTEAHDALRKMVGKS